MSGTPHISDATLAALAARGWKVNGPIAEKLIPDVAPAGALSDGSRLAYVSFEPTGRWLESFDGWKRNFDMDSREWIGRPDAFAAEIERRAIERLRAA